MFVEDLMKQPKKQKQAHPITLFLEHQGLCWGLFAILALLTFVGPINSNDTFLHIGIGKDILQNGLHTQDPFSFTQKNTKYIDHEWLCQVILYLLYAFAGTKALFLYKLVSCCGFLLVLWFLIPDKTRFVYYTPLVLALPLAYTHAQVRPHILAWLLASILMLLIQHKRYWFIPLLMIFWANVHASFVLGLGVLSVFFLEAYQIQKSTKILIQWGISLLSPLLNPFFYKTYLFLFQINEYTHTVDEWLPFKPGTFYFNVFLIFSVLLGFSFLWSSKIKPLRLILSIFLIYLGFSAMRHAIVALIYLSPILFDNLSNTNTSILKIKHQWLTLVFILTIPFLWSFQKKEQNLTISVNHEVLCVQASSFLKKHHVRGQIYNDYNFGGYLIWDQYPSQKVFVDGRLEIYGGQVLKDYYTISKAMPGWESLLEQYQINVVVVRTERAIAQAIAEHPQWDLVYFDYNALIAVKKRTNTHLKRLVSVTPWGNRDRALPEAVIQDIFYLVSENPYFFGGYKIMAFQYAKLNNIEESKRCLQKYLDLHPQGYENKETRYLMRKIGLNEPKI